RGAVMIGTMALATAIVLSGCSSNDPLAQQYRAGTSKNYIAGSGVTEIKPADRGRPVAFSGTTDTGKTVTNADYAGKVLVLNFWYASCPPCRAEAPRLQALYQEFAGKGATFLGVNVRDQAGTALEFEKQFGIGYPSVIDTNQGNMLLAFAGTVAPNAVPTTLVIDKKGRVAARILGEADQSILRTLIADAVAESN
ncbi:MAG: TlpA family protein disulfide reductase, partial [Microbacteriaceae bacterium]